jgi:hypothetical protein
MSKNKIWFSLLWKSLAVREKIVFCVVFCRSMLVLFFKSIDIVLPALALEDLQTLLALFLNQKRVCNFTWLDPIQCEKKPRVQFSIGFNLVWKTRVQFYIKPKWSIKKNKKNVCNFTLDPMMILYDCDRSKYQIKIYYVHFRPLYRPCLPSYYHRHSNSGPPFSSFGPSRDYGMDLCLEVYLWTIYPYFTTFRVTTLSFY